MMTGQETHFTLWNIGPQQIHVSCDGGRHQERKPRRGAVRARRRGTGSGPGGAPGGFCDPTGRRSSWYVVYLNTVGLVSCTGVTCLNDDRGRLYHGEEQVALPTLRYTGVEVPVSTIP
jgi:hypothetical protein